MLYLIYGIMGDIHFSSNFVDRPLVDSEFLEDEQITRTELLRCFLEAAADEPQVPLTIPDLGKGVVV